MKDKKYLNKINELQKAWYSNQNYLSRHPELEKFDMPKTFYFRYFPDRQQMHWAIIVPLNNTYHSPVTVYFINNWGRVFDKLEFKSVKIARRRLRRNGFDFSTNRYCLFTPPEPIYIKLSEGKKSAPYSKGNLWQSVQRNKKHIDKTEKGYIKRRINHYEYSRNLFNIISESHDVIKKTQEKPSGCTPFLLFGIVVALLIFLYEYLFGGY